MAKLGTSRAVVAMASKTAGVVETAQPQAITWKRFLTMEYWFAAVGGMSGLMSIGMGFCLGAACGYLMKRYVRDALGVLIGVACVLALGEYIGVVSIHWEVVRDFVHIRSLHDISVLGSKLYSECLLHARWYVSAIIGFILGHMIG